jgi:phage tail sheath protein FI
VGVMDVLRDVEELVLLRVMEGRVLVDVVVVVVEPAERVVVRVAVGVQYAGKDAAVEARRRPRG